MNLRFAQTASENAAHELLLRHIIEDAAVNARDEQIVYRTSHRQTYEELLDRVHSLASGLRSLGIEPGATVAVMDWDSHRYLEAYFAIPMMGVVLQTVNVRLSVEQIVYCLQSSNASLLLFHGDFAELVEAIAPQLTCLRRRVLIADSSPALPEADQEYENLIATHGRYAFQNFDENALATLFHTTGTTGKPKAVAFSHRQLVLHTLALTGALALQPPGQGLIRNDVYMPLTPMFHVHAWGMPYIATMLGMKQVYPGRYDPAELLRLKQEEQVTFSHCVPTVLQMAVTGAKAAGLTNLGPWTMLIGGSALTQTLQTEAAEMGITALTGYGMSETAPVIAIGRDADGPHAIPGEATRRAGFPIPFVKAMIAGDGMQPLPHDGAAQGELLLRAPWLTRGYEDNPDASEDLWRGGWMHTQDIASIAPNGSITIRDRLKDVIKTGGEWVSSAQIEDLLLTHAGVAEAAVIGVPDAMWTERPFAYVVLRDGWNTEQPSVELREHLMTFVEQGILNRYAVPDGILAIAMLPKTSVGKIDKKLLRAQMP